MDLNEAIYRRRSTRRFTDREVGKAPLMEIIRVGTRAPSALNLQPWAFAVFHDRKFLESMSRRAKAHLVATLDPMFELQPRSQQYAETDYDAFYGAGTLVVIYASGRRFKPTEDCCLAAQNLMLAAHGLGLGTCPVGFTRPWFDLPEVKREFGIPESYTAVHPIVVGYPEGESKETPRKEPEIVSWKWVEA